MSRVACTQSFFLPRKWKTRFPGSKCWCFLSLGRLATTLGSLCRDRFGVQHHPSLGVLRAVCRVSRVHVPCVMRCFFSRKNKKQKQAADPNSLGGTFSLRTRVGAPASVPFSFFFSFAFFFFSQLFLILNVRVFFLIFLYVFVSLWNCMPQLLPSLGRTGLRNTNCHQSLRVRRVYYNIVRDVFSLKNIRYKTYT